MYMERPMFPPFLPNYPQYPQNYQQAQQAQTIPQNNNHAGGITWVNGIEGAKAYQLAPNTTALLMDSEGSRFYIKTTDTSGMPTIRRFSFTEIFETATIPQETPKANYATAEYVAKLEERIKGLEELLTAPAITNTPMRGDRIDG